MEISSLQNTSASAAQQDRNTLFDNFDTFLKLLTTQLQHQDPLEPVGAEKFASQLAQYSGVEQAIKTNSNLEQLLQVITSNEAVASVNYLGKSVTAEGNTTLLQNSQASWNYDAVGAASETIVTIRNSAGQPVFTEEIDLSAGSGTYQWDGQTNDGQIAPDGTYSITFEAQNSNGNVVGVSTIFSGEVTGVNFSGTPTLLVDGVEIPLSSLISVGLSSSPG